MLAHARMLVAEARQHDLFRQGAESVESVQGVQPSQRQGRLGGQYFQRLYGRRVLPLIEQPGGRVAVPAVWMLQKRDEHRDRSASKFG